MQTKSLSLFIVLILLLSIAAAGCIGGEGGGTTSSQSPEGSQASSSSTGSGATTSSSSEHTTTESSGITETTAPSETNTEHASWTNPWDAHNPVKVNGRDYYITSILYTLSISYNNGPKQSFEIRKERGYAQIHVYADNNGQKEDLGTFQVFAYHGKIAPLDNTSLYTLEYWIFVKEQTEEADLYFLAPVLDFSAMYSGKVVAVDIVNGPYRYFWSNPAALGMYDKMPYQEGDLSDALSDIDPTMYSVWMGVIGSSLWTGLEEHDLLTPGQYDWSGMGVSYHYKITPNGEVTFDDKSFRVADVEWSYSFMGVSASGKGKIAPALPIPVEFEGTFGGPAVEIPGWARFKLEDLKLSESIGSLSYEGLTPTETQTQSESQSPTQTTTTTSQVQTLSDNWQLAWDASKPITINGKDYIVKEVTFDADYHVSGGSHVRMLIRKGYHETKLNGEDVYALYAILNIGGETYNYTVYVEPNYLEEYTSGILWVPQVYDMINGPDFVKLEITGPSCHYVMDEQGNIEGDSGCGYISDDFQQYNMILSYPTGFYGGIYGDVLTYVTLTSNGQGYTVEPGDDVSIAGMDFKTYKVIWNGVVQGGLAQANGGTIVAPELPFPVEVTASVSMPGMGGWYIHMKLTDIELEVQ